MKKTLAALALSLAAGCTNLPPKQGGTQDFQSRTPIHTPAPAATEPAIPPFIPQTSAETMMIYERWLPFYDANTDRLLTPPTRRLRNDIQTRHGVHIRGTPTNQSLNSLDDALTNNPTPSTNSTFFILNDRLAIGVRHSIAGWYCNSHTPDHIILFNTADASSFTHELAHQRTYQLGGAFITLWNSLNRHPYGNHLSISWNGSHLWTDTPSEGPRYGFVRAYGSKNALEDIATCTEYFRWELSRLTRPDQETARILIHKAELLKRYNFITENEERLVIQQLLPTAQSIMPSPEKTNTPHNYPLAHEPYNTTENSQKQTDQLENTTNFWNTPAIEIGVYCFLAAAASYIILKRKR